MRNRLAFVSLIGCPLFAVNAWAQTGDTRPLEITKLQAKFEEIAARYEEKCKANDLKAEETLNLIEQGAGLEEGVGFPVTMQTVSALRALQKKITDDMCERAVDYSDLAKIIGEVIESQTSTSR